MLDLNFKCNSQSMVVAHITSQRYIMIDYDIRGLWCYEYVSSGQVISRKLYSAFYDTEQLLTDLSKKGYTHNLEVVQGKKQYSDSSSCYHRETTLNVVKIKD